MPYHYQPDLPETRRSKNSQLGAKSPQAIAIRRAMRSSDPKRLGKKTIRLPDEVASDGHEFIFYQNEGGLRATDDTNDSMATIYYLGVIDILTPYSVIKKVEHFWKGMRADRVRCFISSVVVIDVGRFLTAQNQPSPASGICRPLLCVHEGHHARRRRRRGVRRGVQGSWRKARRTLINSTVGILRHLVTLVCSVIEPNPFHFSLYHFSCIHCKATTLI